jgi:hypothetical protein
VLAHRADLVARLYAEVPDADVMLPRAADATAPPGP